MKLIKLNANNRFYPEFLNVKSSDVLSKHNILEVSEIITPIQHNHTSVALSAFIIVTIENNKNVEKYVATLVDNADSEDNDIGLLPYTPESLLSLINERQQYAQPRQHLYSYGIVDSLNQILPLLFNMQSEGFNTRQYITGCGAYGRPPMPVPGMYGACDQPSKAMQIGMALSKLANEQNNQESQHDMQQTNIMVTGLLRDINITNIGQLLSRVTETTKSVFK